MSDLRVPSGILFSIYGVVLCAFGLISPETTAPLADTNINLAGGVMFLLVGLVMLWLAKRAAL